MLRYIVATRDFYSLICGPLSKTYDEWRSVNSRIASICDRIWHEVKPVLCVDSPEGHTDEPVEDLVVGPKDILSYSWRALRESRFVFLHLWEWPLVTDGIAFCFTRLLSIQPILRRENMD